MDKKTDLIRTFLMSGRLRPGICVLALLLTANTTEGKPLREAPFEKARLAADARAAISVKGRVLDENGEGLPGVSIMVKGKTTGTTTSLDGTY